MQFGQLNRREFITLVGIAGATWPLAASAQQPRMQVIGVLGNEIDPHFTAFHKGLAEAGYVDGHNVAIEYRWAEGRVERYPEFAADLVRHQVAMVVTQGLAAAGAAKAATATIPVVFLGGFDPVNVGLVASLSRPGGNLTGVTNLGLELGTKRLEVMHELIPAAKRFALLINPDHPNAESQSRDMQIAARMLGLQIRIVHARTAEDFDVAFASLSQLGTEGLVIGVGQPFNSRLEQLAALTVRHAVPAIFQHREFAVAGGLVAYAGSISESYRQVGIYSGRILKGDKPGNLP